VNPLIKPPSIAKADSGASAHYFKPEDAATVLHNVTATPNGPSVYLPNGTILQAQRKGQLLLSEHLSPKAQTTQILEGIAESSLISLGQLCDDYCITVLDKNEINIFKNNKCIIKGKHNKADGLWDIPLQPNPHIISERSREIRHTANAIIRKSQAKTELAEYLYGCCGSPAVSTLIHAIKNGN